MLKFTKRLALVGKIQFRPEFHGDAVLTAMDVSVSELSITAAELEELLPGCHGTIPWADRLKQPAFADKIESARVAFTIGLDADAKETALAPVSLSSVKLEPREAGAMFSCQVQCRPDLNPWLLLLLDKVGRKVEVEIQCDTYGSQGALDLPPPTDEAPPMPPEVSDADAARQVDEAIAGLTKADDLAGWPDALTHRRASQLLDKAQSDVGIDDGEKAELKRLFATRRPMSIDEAVGAVA